MYVIVKYHVFYFHDKMQTDLLKLEIGSHFIITNN